MFKLSSVRFVCGVVVSYLAAGTCFAAPSLEAPVPSVNDGLALPGPIDLVRVAVAHKPVARVEMPEAAASVDAAAASIPLDLIGSGANHLGVSLRIDAGPAGLTTSIADEAFGVSAIVAVR